MAILKGSNHRSFVDHLSTSGVNDNASRFQGPDPFFADEANGFLSERHMDAQNVRLSKHLFHVLEVLAEIRGIGAFISGVINDAHWEGMSQNSQTCSNPSKSEDA